MGHLRISILFCAVITTLVSCKRDTPPDPVPPVNAVYTQGQGVFITNEGNFTWGNASVSYYSFDHQLVVADAFQDANSIPLGDVCQSMTVVGSTGYIVVNNSGKIEVVNMSNFSRTATINGFTSPRYLLPVSTSKAYVSDLYSDGISIVDLTANTITGEINIPGWTERMINSNGKVFVTCMERNQLYVVDPNTNSLTDSIAVSIGGNSIVSDANGKLWLLCMGDYATSTPGALHRINPATGLVEWSASFTAGHYPMNLVINSTGTELYYIDQSVFKMQITDSQLPVTAYINAGTRNFYGLGISPANEIYVADARDYVLPGMVYRYNSGLAVDSVQVGVTPGNFCFY